MIRICCEMNSLELHIKGFKCFSDSRFELNGLTLLTGANASGKSSVIQALLFLKAASEVGSTQAHLDLSDFRYAFDFGSPDSLINNDQEDDEVFITLADGGITFNGEQQSYGRILNVSVDKIDAIRSLFDRGVTYFCAERQGPRYEYVRKNAEADGCGCHGENTGNVVSDNWNVKIAGDRLPIYAREDVLFNIALDKWIDYIFPGIAVRIKHVGSQNYKVIIRDNKHNVATEATNIGFGISYSLPILVGALLARKGGWLVVENPEAHIHAKAQSNMGYFLGMMAGSGLRVLVETHSEHVVNGIRRAAVVSGRFAPEDINIYFFSGRNNNTLISMDTRGNLSDFPVDFFDQSRQDMLEIIKVSKG